MSSQIARGVRLCTDSHTNNIAVASKMLAQAISINPDKPLSRRRKVGDLLDKRVRIFALKEPYDPSPIVDYLGEHPGTKVIIDPHVVCIEDIRDLAADRSVDITGRLYSLPYNPLHYSMQLSFGPFCGVGEIGRNKSFDPLHEVFPPAEASNLSGDSFEDFRSFLDLLHSLSGKEVSTSAPPP